MRRLENSCWPGCELLGWLVAEACSRPSLAAVMGLGWRTTFVCIVYPTRGSESIQVFVVMRSSFWGCDGCLCDVRFMTLAPQPLPPTKETNCRTSTVYIDEMRLLLSAVVQRIIARLREADGSFEMLKFVFLSALKGGRDELGRWRELWGINVRMCNRKKQ